METDSPFLTCSFDHSDEMRRRKDRSFPIIGQVVCKALGCPKLYYPNKVIGAEMSNMSILRFAGEIGRSTEFLHMMLSDAAVCASV